jgi:hypothetical protein
MFPSQLPQLLTDYAVIFEQCSIRYFEQLSLLYISRNVRIRRMCGEKLSKSHIRPADIYDLKGEVNPI